MFNVKILFLDSFCGFKELKWEKYENIKSIRKGSIENSIVLTKKSDYSFTIYDVKKVETEFIETIY